MQIGPASDQAAIVTALKNAADATGSDFHYLLGTAMRESSLKPQAQSSTSSAAGLFQFLDQTWLGLVKEHGAKYGLGREAGQITKQGDRFRCADDDSRTAILALRKNPQIASFMAGEFAKATAGQMQTNLGRGVCGGELYAAHFLGPDAACKLIRLNDAEPGAKAASLFPHAADANKSIFFHADGAAKSVREVYDWVMRQPGAPTVQVAKAEPAATPHASAMVTAAHAVSQNTELLLSSVMNWQPKGFFSSSDDSSSRPFGMGQVSIGHGLLDVLSGTGRS